MKRDESESERAQYKRQLTHFREFNEYAEHTPIHTHTPIHLTGIFGSKGNVRQIQGSNIYAPRASKSGEETEGRGNIQQTRIKNAKRIKKGATGTANLVGKKRKTL